MNVFEPPFPKQPYDETIVNNAALQAALDFENVVTYGADPTGVSDSTTAILAADAAAQSTGGAVYFPSGTYRCDGQLTLDSAASGGGIETMRPRRWIGDGAWNDTTASAIVTPQGTVLDCRYASGPSLLLKPRGGFEMAGIAISQRGTAHTQPMVKITNTTCHIHDCAFIGHSTKSGVTCDQDAIVFGGTTLDVIGNDDDSPFQGYGTTIDNCYFNRIRRCATWRMFANDVRFAHNTVWSGCGGDYVIWLDPVMSGQYVGGASISDNVIEMTNYVRFLKMRNAVFCEVRHNGLYDETATLSAVSYVFVDEGCSGNVFMTGPSLGQIPFLNTTVGCILINTAQNNESVWSNQNPLRSDNFRSAISSFDHASGGMVAQPASTVTETTSDTIGMWVRKKDGTTMWRQQANGTITIGADIAAAFDAPEWYLSNTGVGRKAAGGNFKVSTGSGGSVLSLQGYIINLVDHTDAVMASITSGGVVKIFGLPTSNPGVANQLWNDSGTLKISS